MATMTPSFKEIATPGTGGMIGSSRELRDIWHSVTLAVLFL